MLTGHLGVRFIPTGVGNALIPKPEPLPVPVHPHGRGERLRKPLMVSAMAGSSPRAWGTLAHVFLILVARRFIPTGVGNA